MMGTAWPETLGQSGNKTLTVHDMADGFLITMRWNWADTGINQEIIYFSPLDQAREIAEHMLTHIGRIRVRQLNLGAPKPDNSDIASPDNPVS
jgi:hypothetical protein